MAKRDYKRRRLLIDGSQYRLLAVYLIHFVAVIVIVFSAFVIVFARQLADSSLTVYQQQEVAAKMMWFYAHLWPFMWGIFMLLVVHSIYVTHKIAGPLYQIRNVLRAVKGGDLTARVRIRNRDYLRKEEEVVNELIDTCREKIEGLNQILHSTGSTMSSLRRAIETGAADETRRYLTEADTHVDSMSTALGYFKVPAWPVIDEEEVAREATVEDLSPVA